MYPYATAQAHGDAFSAQRPLPVPPTTTATTYVPAPAAVFASVNDITSMDDLLLHMHAQYRRVRFFVYRGLVFAVGFCVASFFRVFEL